jgi:uncharacterized protein
MARGEFAEYLALNWPTRQQAVRAFGIMAIVMSNDEIVAHPIAGRSQGSYSDVVVGGPGGMLIVLIARCIAAPIFEEFVVRGFMFRGWSQSLVGPIGAIVLTSAPWAMLHTQYGWFGRVMIFGDGLALGYFRWRSNSTWLTVMIHSALNTVRSFMSGPYV